MVVVNQGCWRLWGLQQYNRLEAGCQWCRPPQCGSKLPKSPNGSDQGVTWFFAQDLCYASPLCSVFIGTSENSWGFLNNNRDGVFHPLSLQLLRCTVAIMHPST
jgi:hypothetical protein